jgi:hypothetical protein
MSPGDCVIFYSDTITFGGEDRTASGQLPPGGLGYRVLGAPNLSAC